MSEQTYTVQGMTCGHCAAAVTREVERVGGVDAVRVDVGAGTVIVETTGVVSDEAITAAVAEAGYTVVATR